MGVGHLELLGASVPSARWEDPKARKEPPVGGLEEGAGCRWKGRSGAGRKRLARPKSSCEKAVALEGK